MINQYYAIKAPDGTILPYTIRKLKTVTLNKFEGCSLYPWATLYRQGYRCVKVEIKEII